LFNGLFGWVPDPKIESLLWAILYVLMLYAIAYAMYRRKWFIKF
jgi:predicted acyltransferase